MKLSMIPDTCDILVHFIVTINMTKISLVFGKYLTSEYIRQYLSCDHGGFLIL